MSDPVRLRTGSTILPQIIEGISPEVELTPQTGGVLMTVTTKSGTKSALIPAGPTGPEGPMGPQGLQGIQGPAGDDYVLTEEDIAAIQAAYDEVKADILEAAEQVAGDKAAAASSATAAAGSATAAAASATSAAGNKQTTADLVEAARQYALAAEQSKSDAETAAEAAAGSESAAEAAAESIGELINGFDETVQTAEAMIDGAKATALGSISTAQGGALDEIADAKADAISDIADAETAALGDISDAKDAALTDIAEAKSDIGDSVDAAAASATAAASSAADAAGSATDAAGSATAAAESASSAAESAQEIEEIAEELPELIEDVSSLKSAFNELKPRVDSLEINKADVIISSASGSIASFSDGADGMPVKELTVAIEPVQDLHGYDSPWPAGGGKNLFDGDYPNIGSLPKYRAINVGDGTFTMSSDIPLSPNNNAANLFFLAGNVSSGVSTVSNGVYKNQSRTVTAVDGYVTVAYRNLDSTNPANYNVQIESGSSATSFAPYSNICPITGWTGAEVCRTGVNIWGGLDFAQVFLDNQPSAVLDTINKTITHPYLAGAANQFKCFDVFKPSTVYTVILTASSEYNKANLIVYYTDGSYQYFPNFTSTDKSRSILTTYAGKSVKQIMSTNQQGSTTFYYDECGVFEGVVTADQFTAYQGNTYPISFPSSAGTVYGAELTVNKDGSGVLTIDRYYLTLANAKSSSYHSGTTPSMWIYFADNVIADASTALNCITNMYVVGGSSVTRANLYGSEIDVYDSRFTDETTARELLSNFVAVYKLHSTKIITVQLTTQQLSTLLGQNNIWADTGNVSVTYRADTKLYIDNKVTQAIAAALNA